MQEHQKYSKNLPASRTLTPAGAKGISIIELLVAILIMGVAVYSLISFSTFSLRTASLLKHTTQASFFVQDYIEALKNYRDNTLWTNDDPLDKYDGLGVVLTGVPLRLELSEGIPPQWQLLSGAETIGIFTREIVIESVERDITDNIVESGGTIDPQIKKATVNISWEERGGTKELEITTYLTNWR